MEHWNDESGAVWISRLLKTWPKAIWLNPEPEERYSSKLQMRIMNKPSIAAVHGYAIAMGAFQGTVAILPLFLAAVHGVTEENIGWFFMYIGAISVIARALILGPTVDWLGEAKLSRVGMVLLAAGLITMPLADGWVELGIAVALVPLGTAFTFPCVTSMLSQGTNLLPGRPRLGIGSTRFGAQVAAVVAPLLIESDHRLSA